MGLVVESVPMEIRKPRKEELHSIYLMGFDVWSEGLSEEDYVNACMASQNYQDGTWYVLAKGNELVASLILYESQFNIPEKFCGIGSVATAMQHRKQGYSSQLVNGICDILEQSGYSGVYLHSDIDPEFYQRLGFVLVAKENARCMVRMFGSAKVPEDVIPAYF